MCYREGVPPLNFESFRMACLCGDNGHGKSALLDAMTWALWGKSRARSNDELVHLGQTEMAVEFEFDVHPHRYRLIRRYRSRVLKRPGQTSLELSVKSNGQYQPLTSGVEESEKKIRELIKLDYDTFVNSAFLRQGKADEFTRKTPSERKEILASILNLSFFDQLTEKAKENRNLKLQEHLRVQALIENNKKEIEKKEAYLQQKGLVVQSLQLLSLEIDSARIELEKSRNDKQILETKETQARQTEENLGALKKDEQAWLSRVERHIIRISGFNQLIDHKDEIEKYFKKYHLYRGEEKTLSEKLGQLTKLREKRTQVEKILEQEGNQLRNSISHIVRTVSEMEQKISRKTGLLNKLEEIQKLADIIQKKTEELEGKKKSRSLSQEHVFTLQAEQKRWGNLLKDLKEKKSFIEPGKDTCPLCGSALGQDGLKKVEEHYQEEMQNGYRTLTEVESNLKNELDNVKKLQTTDLEKDLDVKKRQHERDTSLTQMAIEEVKEAESKLPEAKTSLEDLVHRLESGQYAPEQKSAIASLDTEIAGLGYDEGLHTTIKKEIAALERFQREKILLDEATREVERERAEEKQASSALSEKKKQVELEKVKLAELKKELASLPEVRAKTQGLESRFRTREQEKEESVRQLGGLEENLKGCTDKERENERLEIERSREEHEIKIYDRLAEAFGKKGVQALIIETSLPEIGNEANDLLARLTDGRMSLQLEMRSESPGGKITESLEIKIADELGTRNYEMFSGGEAFRIDFALRIALSKFLARRAGAPLSLLIIDEGFGSQDEKGKERLIEALNYIQNDFDKILVITHLPELKEYFPYRINVTKTEEGSTISMEEG